MREPSDESKNDCLVRIDKEQYDFYHGVMERYQNHCVVCYPMESDGGVTVHEIVSKAQNPNGWWKSIDNGVTLCNEHHDQAHQLSTRASRFFLDIHTQKTLRALG